jgi:hypothetical protein
MPGSPTGVWCASDIVDGPSESRLTCLADGTFTIHEVYPDRPNKTNYTCTATGVWQISDGELSLLVQSSDYPGIVQQPASFPILSVTKDTLVVGAPSTEDRITYKRKNKESNQKMDKYFKSSNTSF